MLVAFPLRDPAEFSRQLKDVLHQRTPANFIHGDLMTRQKTQSFSLSQVRISLRFKILTIFKVQGKQKKNVKDLNFPWPLDLWNVLDTKPEASYNRFYFGGCTRHRRVWLLCEEKKNWSRLRWIYHRTFVNQSSSSSSHPSILVGYIEPKEVWLSYCRDT